MHRVCFIALALLVAPPAVFGQAPECEGEWAVDGMGLRMRDEDGNWRYWSPGVGRLSRSLTLLYADGDTEKRLVVGQMKDPVEKVFGTARVEWLIRNCSGALNAALARVYGAPDFLFFESDRPLPPIGVIPLWRDPARPAGDDEFLLAIPGSDLAVRRDDLFVLVGDRLPGDAVHVLALSPGEQTEVTGPASDIVADLSERGATDLDDIEVRGDATGALILDLRVRGADRGWRDASYRIEPPIAADVAEEVGPAAAAEVDDSRGGELVCRQGNMTMNLEVPPGRLDAVMEEVAKPLGYSKSDCRFDPRE